MQYYEARFVSCGCNYILMLARHVTARRVAEQQRVALNDLASLLDVMLEMLDVEHTSQLVLRSMDVNTAVSVTVADMARRIQEKSQMLTLQLQENLPLVAADEDRLSRVFFHILRNAAQFTPAAGQITIETCCHVTAIHDTGMGMMPAELAQIFQRFYRADKAQTSRGFGLGLSIAQKIITLHNGFIQVSSAPNVGSTFRIYLPVLPTEDAIV